MSYYDHATSLVLKRGVWKSEQSLRQSECRTWVLEKEVAERSAEKSSGTRGGFTRSVVDFLSRKKQRNEPITDQPRAHKC